MSIVKLILLKNCYIDIERNICLYNINNTLSSAIADLPKCRSIVRIISIHSINSACVAFDFKDKII